MKKIMLFLFFACAVSAYAPLHAQSTAATVTITPANNSWNVSSMYLSPQVNGQPITFTGKTVIVTAGTPGASFTISGSMSLIKTVSPVPGPFGPSTAVSHASNSPFSISGVAVYDSTGTLLRKCEVTGTIGNTFPYQQRTFTCEGDADISVNGGNNATQTKKNTWKVTVSP
jgi:hypothetical protein